MSFDIFKDKVTEIKHFDFGNKFEFTSDSFPVTPKEITNENIKISLRNRFISNGLKDFLVADISKDDSIAFGLWILSCYFQRNHYQYKIKLSNEDSTIKEIRIDFRLGQKYYSGNDIAYVIKHRPVQFTLDKFIWQADKVEQFTKECEFYFNQKIMMLVTSDDSEAFTLEEFNSRNIMVGFGKIGGGLLAAEFFINLGLEKSDVNYEHLSHDFYRKLCCEDSSDFRAEVYHQSPNTESENPSELD